jgi:hypothetical protein
MCAKMVSPLPSMAVFSLATVSATESGLEMEATPGEFFGMASPG